MQQKRRAGKPDGCLQGQHEALQGPAFDRTEASNALACRNRSV